MVNNIVSQYMAEIGKRGGKASVETRFAGMTKKQRSEYMRRVRLCKKIINKKTWVKIK